MNSWGSISVFYPSSVHHVRSSRISFQFAAFLMFENLIMIQLITDNSLMVVLARVPSSAAFPSLNYQGAGSQVEQARFEPRPMWDASAAGQVLPSYTTLWAPEYLTVVFRYISV